MVNSDHPRYLLDEDSLCYGCYHYDSVEETDPTEDLSDCDIDDNGGYCNCNQMCVEGSQHKEAELWVLDVKGY